MVDALDAQIVELFTNEPGIGVLEASRRLRVARPTVQARLNRMHETGVIQHIAPILNPAAFGFPVTAICGIELDQARDFRVAQAAFEKIPEILDMYTTSGEDDVTLRIVARSNADLQRVFDLIMASNVVTRTRSSIVLNTQFFNKATPLLREAATSQE